MARKVNILAFDTSSSACSIALQHHDQIKLIHQHAPMLHAKLILPLIEDMLNSFSLRPSDLDAIAYGCGPGSFTGIRLASSVAQAIAFASACAAYPVSSLAALAQSTYLEHGWEKILVAVDARMGEIYLAAYQIGEHDCVELWGEEKVYSATDLNKAILALPHLNDWHGVGDGWAKIDQASLLSDGFQTKSITLSTVPSGESVLQLAKNQIKKGSKGISVNDIFPSYLR